MATPRAPARVFFDIAEARHSPDHAKLAWSADDNGSELHAIRVRDLHLGADSADVVHRYRRQPRLDRRIRGSSTMCASMK